MGMEPSRNQSAQHQVPQPLPQAVPQAVQPIDPRSQAMHKPKAAPICSPLLRHNSITRQLPWKSGMTLWLRRSHLSQRFRSSEAKSYDEAADQFEELLKKYPQSHLAADATYSIGEARSGQGRFEEAVLQFDRVIKEFPGSKKELDAYLKQGHAFEKMVDPKSARTIYQQLISQNPHAPQGPQGSSQAEIPSYGK